jgi:hypothetical protein
VVKLLAMKGADVEPKDQWDQTPPYGPRRRRGKGRRQLEFMQKRQDNLLVEGNQRRVRKQSEVKDTGPGSRMDLRECNISEMWI